MLADPAPREGALRIEGASITARATRAPKEGKRIDARGLFVLPAVIDAHVHLSVAGEAGLVPREALRRGVAGVPDLGAPAGPFPLRFRPPATRSSGPLPPA